MENINLLDILLNSKNEPLPIAQPTPVVPKPEMHFAYQKKSSKSIAQSYSTLDAFVAELKAKGLKKFTVYTQSGSKPIYAQ